MVSLLKVHFFLHTCVQNLSGERLCYENDLSCLMHWGGRLMANKTLCHINETTTEAVGVRYYREKRQLYTLKIDSGNICSFTAFLW